MKLAYKELESFGVNWFLWPKFIEKVRDAGGEFGGVFELGFYGYILFCRFLRQAATLLLGMYLHRQFLAVAE